MATSPARPASPVEETPQENNEWKENVISPDSIRAMTDAVGIIPLHEDATRELAEHATYRLRQLLQDASKYTKHGKRQKLLCEDIDMALRMEGQEPLYGSVSTEHEPFRFASGGGRECHFVEEKELDLQALVSAPVPKIPLGVSLRAHWLAVDGVQPAIPENPPAQNKEQLRSEATNPLSKLKKDVDAMGNKLGSLTRKPTKLKTTETVNVKQLAKHELSVEQQLYYKEITEACVGSDETRRAEALQSLACDPGLHQMLPRLCTFIAEGVRVNVVQHNLAILIYLMRMVKSLLENQTLFLEKYLHELIPAVTTCIVARQLCTRPDVDNHWALRDFASRLMANICKNFNTSTNNIQTRVTRMFCEALRSEKTPVVSYYGALAGLQELGPEVIKTLILPQISAISARIDSASDVNQQLVSNPNVEKKAVEHILTLIRKHVAPVLKSVLKQPELNQNEFRTEYGSLGPHLFSAIQKLKTTNPPNATNQPVKTESGTTCVSTPTTLRQAQIPSGTLPQQPLAISQPQLINTPNGPRYVVVNPQGQQQIVNTNPGQVRFVATTSQNTTTPGYQQFYQQ